MKQVIETIDDLPVDSPERVYLWAKYITKGKVDLEKEQILYQSPRMVYFYAKFLNDLKIEIPEHLNNFMLAISGSSSNSQEKEFILNFLKLNKKNSK